MPFSGAIPFQEYNSTDINGKKGHNKVFTAISLTVALI
jgi:hypothetical protein